MAKKYCLLLALLCLLAYPACAGSEDAAPLVLSAHIHESLPEMTFTRSVAGTQVRDDWYPETIYRVEITNQDASHTPVQTLYYTSQVEMAPYGLTLVDMNFDGFLDIEAVYIIGVSNQFSIYFLWNPEQNQFVSPYGMNGLANYTRYPEKNLIYNYVQDSALTGTHALYTWRNGSLMLLRRAAIQYAQDGFAQETVTDYTTDGKSKELLAETFPLDVYDAATYEKHTAHLLALLWDGYQ